MGLVWWHALFRIMQLFKEATGTCISKQRLSGQFDKELKRTVSTRKWSYARSAGYVILYAAVLSNNRGIP